MSIIFLVFEFKNKEDKELMERFIDLINHNYDNMLLNVFKTGHMVRKINNVLRNGKKINEKTLTYDIDKDFGEHKIIYWDNKR